MFASTAPLDASLDRQSQLSRLMVGWRKDLIATKIPELVRTGRARPNDSVSQEDMALLTGVSLKWYGELERGNWRRNYSGEFLLRVADVLDLDDGSWRTLYQLLKQQDPPPRCVPRQRTPKPTEGIEDVLALLPVPGWLCDAAWNIVYANDATHMWFDGLAAEGNYMRWMLCHPAARLQFDDWEPIARRLLAQLTAQAARLDDVEPIKTVIRQILDRSETASRWWAREPLVWLHEDGNRRTIHLPDAPQSTTVEIVSTNPLRDCQLRTYTVLPKAGYLPPDNWLPSTQPRDGAYGIGRLLQRRQPAA